MASPLLSEIAFGSFLAYSPRGSSDPSVRSRNVRHGVKAGSEDMLRRAMARLVQDFAGSGLDAVLGPDVTLVPAPRSSQLVEGGLWPSRLLAEALVASGLGQAVLPCLVRAEAVPKSAFSRRGERPTALRHYETMRAEPELLASDRITLVDDFVTKGNTLLGGASRVKEAFPNAEVAAFALMRTLGLQPEIERLIDPCVGTIRASFDEARRDP